MHLSTKVINFLILLLDGLVEMQPKNPFPYCLVTLFCLDNHIRLQFLNLLGDPSYLTVVGPILPIKLTYFKVL